MAAFWDNLTKGKDGKEVNDKAKTSEGKTKPAKKGSKKDSSVVIANEERSGKINSMILRPVISEDAFNKQAEGKYVFEVSLRANKSEVAKSIESMYGVAVEKVNMVQRVAKPVVFKGKTGTRKGNKKAIVTVKKGQKIEIFKEA